MAILLQSVNVPAIQKAKAQDISMPITKDLTVTLNTLGESLSDMEYWEFGPKGQQLDYKMFQNEGDMTADTTFNLGTQSDERSGCTTVVQGRRVGICEDGNYTFQIQSTDAAGNKSGQTSYVVERDTVRPAKPTGSVFICGYNICINVEGEKNTDVLAYSRIRGNTTYTGRTNTLVAVYSFKSDTNYNIPIKLSDTAGNESEILTLFIHTPIIGIGDGVDILPGSETDPWGGLSDQTLLQNSKLNIYIDKDNKIETNTALMPEPLITRIVQYEHGEVEVWGIGIDKDSQINADIHKETKNLNEALWGCPLLPHFFLNSNIANDCLNKNLNTKEWYDNYINFLWKECNATHLFDNIECWKGYRHNFTMNLKLEIDSSEIVLFKDQQFPENIVSKRDCEVGQICYDEGRRYWNDFNNGRWQMKFQSGTLLSNNEITDRIFSGNTFTINIDLPVEDEYFRYDYDYGLMSSTMESPSKEVPKFAELLNPLKFYCSSDYYISRGVEDYYSSFLGRDTIHWAVDMAGKSNCDIGASAEGTVTFAGWKKGGQGFNVEIDHKNGFITRYYHGLLEPYVNTGDKVVKGQKIMQRDNTGNSHGTHLHFEVLKDGQHVDPKQYVKF